MPRTSQVTAPLLGRNSERSLLVLGVAVILFIGIFFLGTVSKTRGWEVNIYSLVPVVLVVGGAIAAGNAYWNDGLVASWILVFAPVFGWLWHGFVQGPVSFNRVFPPLAFAVFSAAFVGTVGHAVGLHLRRRTTLDTVDDPSGWLFRVLVGHDPVRSVRWVLLAGGLFFVASTLIYVDRLYLPLSVGGVGLFGLFFPLGAFIADPLLGTIVILGWLGLAMWPAYRDDGLFVSWGLLFGPLFGASLTIFLMGGLRLVGPLVEATSAFLLALIFALILGTGGFVLGMALRSTVSRQRSDDKGDVSS